MKLDDALVNVVRLGFDTAPFIYFIERHNRSLLGILAPYVKRSLSEEEWDQAREEAAAAAAREFMEKDLD